MAGCSCAIFWSGRTSLLLVLVLLLLLAYLAVPQHQSQASPVPGQQHQQRQRKMRHNNNRARHERIRDSPMIETTLGPVRGLSKTVHGRAVHVFMGIPFAKPPVGPLRFKKPVPAEPWDGVFEASSLPNSCVQESYEYYPGFPGEEMWNPNTNVSEDCLYLNLWVPDAVLRRVYAKDSNDNSRDDSGSTPSSSRVLMDDVSDPREQNDGKSRGGGSSSSKPSLSESSQDKRRNNGAPSAGRTNGSATLVWIYGGAYMSGTSALDVYDGDILAATEGLIVASINYRVGALGFLCLGMEQFPCNQGLWDQVMGLKWIRDNIAKFGGDPELLTIFGESAGGGSVSTLFLSPVSRHLAKRGIMQSGTVNAPWSYMSYQSAKEKSLAVIDYVECDSSTLRTDFDSVYACLMEMPSKNFSVMQWYVYDVGIRFPFAPTVDGVFLPRDPLAMLRDGDFKNTEVLLGSNLDEGSYFVLYDFMTSFNKDDASLLTRSQYEVIMSKIFKDLDPLEFSAVLFQYTDWEGVENGKRNQQMITAALGDYNFVCPTNYFAQLYSNRGNDVYYYYFTWRSSTNPWGDWMGVMHGDEIDYVFGHPLNKSRSFTKEERELSKRIMRHYANFARTGDPSLESGPMWPKYTRENPVYLELNAANNKAGGDHTTGRGPKARECAFWNEFMPHLRVASNDPEGQPRCGMQTSLVSSSSDASAELKSGAATAIIRASTISMIWALSWNAEMTAPSFVFYPVVSLLTWASSTLLTPIE